MPRTNFSSTTASPAASSPRDLPQPGGLCAVHQPNFLPRLTTLAKLFAADYWIVLDDVQFTRRDYQHRARLADLGDPARHQWLTLPTHLPQGRSTLIRDAAIAEPERARRRTAGMLRQHYGASPHWPALAQALDPVLDAFTPAGPLPPPRPPPAYCWTCSAGTAGSSPAADCPPGRAGPSGSRTSQPQPEPARICAGPAAWDISTRPPSLSRAST